MSKTNGGIEGVNADEKLLALVNRDPFGLIIVYVEVLLGLLGVGALLFFLLPTLLSSGSDGTSMLLIGIMSLIAVLAILLLGVATQIYNENKLIITDKNVTQVFQRGLFSRQVSELSMANVEDVTADQRGIFAHLFGYGELRIETAGEQDNFHFIYCPKPDYYGKMVLDARQQYVQKNPS
jgi:uncharacterized membrane protein YdbT with pleckstrin-like domain